MPWHRKYRLLLVIYGICLLVGGREWWLSRGSEPPGWFTEEGRALAEVLVRVTPDEADTEFIQGMQSLASGDVAEYERFLEEALARNPKHNDMLLRFHAQHLIDTGADWVTVNQALNRWRINHPFDVETINYYIDRGPETDLQLAALEDALLRVALDRARVAGTDRGRGWDPALAHRDRLHRWRGGRHPGRGPGGGVRPARVTPRRLPDRLSLFDARGHETEIDPDPIFALSRLGEVVGRLKAHPELRVGPACLFQPNGHLSGYPRVAVQQA